MGVASTTEQASAVDDVAFGGNPVPNGDIGHEAANRRHVACKLVADDEWRSASSPRPGIPIEYVHVSAANAGPTDPDQHLVIPDARFGDVGQNEPNARRLFDQRLHANLSVVV
ncbi:MAG: hypothetical protein NVS1B4_14620 [Gemmatimonadaceae bacterium]